MKPGGIRLSLVCAALAALVLPGAASASEHRPKGKGNKGTEVFVDGPDGPYATFQAKGSNGFQIYVEISPEHASITAKKESDSDSEERDEFANYDLFGGSATMHGARANFGRVGKIAVRFKPSGKVHRFKDKECKGGPEVERAGTFEGTIRFEGENGFTRFVAKRARGELSFTPRQVCREPKIRIEHHHPRQEKEPIVTNFFAVDADSSASTLFVAVQSEEEPEVAKFNAESEEDRGDLFIRRSVDLEVPAAAFSVNPSADSATVTPPAPFSGSATYTQIDDSASRWQGPLTVSFPGRPDVPLTGRGYYWRLGREEALPGTFASAFS